MTTGPQVGPIYEFGPFCLDAGQLLLFHRNEPLYLPKKDLETLLVLLERHGRIVEKDVILEKVWPGTFIEEGNLAKHVSNIRQALGDGTDGVSYIETIPRRGYRFIAPVKEVTGGSAEGTSAAPAKSRPWKLPLAFAALGLAVIAGLGYWLSVGRAALSFSSRDWVLVADFENYTGDSRFDKALLMPLKVALEQSPRANIVPGARVNSALGRMRKPADQAVNEEIGREICVRESIRALLVPTVTRAGQQYALSARLLDPKDGSVARSFSERARTEDELLTALDRLVGSVRQSLGESVYSISRASRPLPQVTTPSLVALQLFAEANDSWHKNRLQDAERLYLAALERDPDFVAAHAALGNLYFSFLMSQPEKGKAHYEKALQLSGRTTEREIAFLKASYESSQSHRNEAIVLFREYLRTYPDDFTARYNLGTDLMAARRFEEAIAELNEAARLDPSSPRPQINLATCHVLLGRYSEALHYHDRAFELDPSLMKRDNLNHEYGFTLAAAGQLEKAREVFSQTLTKHAGLRSLALLDMYLGKYRAAVPGLREANRLLSGPNDGIHLARNHLFLATIASARGDSAGELGELRDAEKISDTATLPLWLRARIAVAYARRGSLKDADRILSDLNAKTDEKNNQHRSDRARVQGEIELARKNYPRALELLLAADQASSSPLTRESLARAYAGTAKEREAAGVYEQLLSTPGWIGWEGQQAWLTAHYELARLYLAMGEKEKAKGTLESFLNLWKDADPDLSLLREARQLQNQFAR
jgi:DNA-binding winged helix-turn-helix (wHTH) protein/tetratricopeptide (TPR) repeat protein